MRPIIVALVLGALTTGCTIPAPEYNADITNISHMRMAGYNKIAVDEVKKDPESSADVDRLTIRGNNYVSPYGSFTSYLAEALRKEIKEAQLYDENSDRHLSATLLKNNLDGAGIITGIAEIEANFIVRDASTIRYDKTLIAQHTWESSFLGGIAIPRTAQNYPVVVQKLLKQLFSDEEFLAAIR